MIHTGTSKREYKRVSNNNWNTRRYCATEIRAFAFGVFNLPNPGCLMERRGKFLREIGGGQLSAYEANVSIRGLKTNVAHFYRNVRRADAAVCAHRASHGWITMRAPELSWIYHINTAHRYRFLVFSRPWHTSICRVTARRAERRGNEENGETAHA